MSTAPAAALRGLRGRVIHEVGVRWNRAEARAYDRRRGTDTGGKASMRQLGVGGVVGEHGTGFQSVNARHLRTVLRELRLPLDAGFLDLGCGKGKAVVVAAEHGFTRCVGVDVVEELCRVAAANVRLLGLDDRVEVVCGNGLDHAFGQERVVFVNNPFSAELLETLVDRLSTALAARDEPAWLVYANPAWQDVVERHGGWREIRRFGFFGPGRDMVAYARQPGASRG